MKNIKKLLNNKKRIFKFIIIFVLLLITLLLVNNREGNEQTVKEISNVENKPQDNKLQYKIKEIENNNSILQNSIMSLKSDIVALKAEIEYLKTNIVKIENQNPVYSENNLQITILLNKIQKLYYTNKNFSTELDYLKLLVKNRNNNLFELVNKLNEYKTFHNNVAKLNEIFTEEYKVLLTSFNKNDSNIFKDFINDNIAIRRIDNIDTNTVNTIINNIKEEIQNNNYINAIDIIKKSNYEDSFFKNTYKILDKITAFDINIDEIYKIIFIE